MCKSVYLLILIFYVPIKYVRVCSCVYLQYSGDQVLFSQTFQWEVSHELHYGWTKTNIQHGI